MNFFKEYANLQDRCKSVDLSYIKKVFESEFINEYLDTLSEKTADKMSMQIFLLQAEYIKKQCEILYSEDHLYACVLEMMWEFHVRFSMPETREDKSNIYNVETVIMVMLLAQMCGCVTCKDVSDFWFKNNLYLQYLVPGMPSPKHMISPETVRLVRILAPEDAVLKLLTDRFSGVKQAIKSFAHQHTDDSEKGLLFRPTVGFDGQELKASYREGETSRHKKGAHAVTAFDCDNRLALSCTTVQKKNQEIPAIKTIFDNFAVDDNAIIYADAINTRRGLTSFLDELILDYLLPLKSNHGNRAVYAEVKGLFEKTTSFEFITSDVSKTSGRVETREFALLSADELEKVKALYPRIKSVLRYRKTSQRIINGAVKQDKPSTHTTYLISTLEYSENSFNQLIHSVSVRWLYETHHNTLDVVMMQDSLALKDQDHLSYVVTFNKILYNLMSYTRIRMKDNGAVRPIKHRTQKAKDNEPPISFQRCFSLLRNDPFNAMRYLVEYFMSEDVEKTSQSAD